MLSVIERFTLDFEYKLKGALYQNPPLASKFGTFWLVFPLNSCQRLQVPLEKVVLIRQKFK